MSGGNGKSSPAAEQTGIPILTPWQPYPPVRFLPNHDSARGHKESKDGRRCLDCKAVKPLGGWNAACPKGAHRRSFKGAA